MDCVFISPGLSDICTNGWTVSLSFLVYWIFTQAERFPIFPGYSHKLHLHWFTAHLYRPKECVFTSLDLLNIYIDGLTVSYLHLFTEYLHRWMDYGFISTDLPDNCTDG